MNYSGFVSLVEDAEKAMIAKGVSLDDRIYMFSGIYYATTWCVEYLALHADDRREAMEHCLHKSYSPTDDPRPIIGAHLYGTLLANKDVAGSEPVDVGHLFAGLAARISDKARNDVMGFSDMALGMPTFGLTSTKSTGLEIMTWVGDLGGAAGRLAIERATVAAATPAGRTPIPVPASRFFHGGSYGDPGNLYGDVFSYTLAPASTGMLDRPAIGPPLMSPMTVGDAVHGFFLSASAKAKPGARATSCKTFLQMVGGTYVAGALANQVDVENNFADKFEAFGSYYMLSYLKTFVVKAPPPPPVPTGGSPWDKVQQLGQEMKQGAQALINAGVTIEERWRAAKPYLRQAAEDVARLFMTKLLANNLR